MPIVGVTGAAGHLGANVCRLLLDGGYRVRALVRSSGRALEGLDLETTAGDVRDSRCLEAFVSGCDFVIHCAATISVHGGKHGEVVANNVDGTRAIVAACSAAGVKRLVYVSSTHAVRPDPFDEPFDESRPLKGAGSPSYDYSKALSESMVSEAVKAGRLDAIILRPSSLLGPFDFKPSLLGQALIDLRAGSVPALTNGGYNFLDVRDAAAACVAALGRGQKGEVYLLSGAYKSLREVSRAVTELSGARQVRVVVPRAALYVISPFMSFAARIRGKLPRLSAETLRALAEGHPDMRPGKAMRELGFTSRPYEESVRDFFAWWDESQAPR